MTVYSTKIAANKSDKAVFTNPLTDTEYKRGELNVKVDQKEIVGDKAQAVVKKQTDYIINTTPLEGTVLRQDARTQRRGAFDGRRRQGPPHRPRERDLVDVKSWIDLIRYTFQGEKCPCQ